jgi:curved DNA-binding protein CbpA
MIINPLVAAAAVAARAVGTIFPGDWMGRRSSRYPGINFQPWHDDEHFHFTDDDVLNTGRQYHSNIENDVYRQSKEFDSFTMTYTPFIFQDAEILSKDTIKPDRPPKLPNTNNPWKLLGIDTGDKFNDIRRAWKKMAKIYHPDVVVGPDASADERRDANEDFARINAAFEFLKRKASEEIYEYNTYIDGEQVTKSVVVVPGESRQMDPYRINYDRIIEMSEYRKHRPQTKMWYEAENDYHQRQNGFAAYPCDSYSKGKWWHTKRFAQRTEDFGTIQSKETMWDNRNSVVEAQDVRRTNEFGFTPNQDRWWDDKSSQEGPVNNRKYRVGSNNHRPANQESYPPIDKWWKGNASAFDKFSP